MSRPEPALAPPTRIRDKRVIAWVIWDLASSSFGSVVTTFVFTVYLTSGAFGPKASSQQTLANAIGIAGVVVALFAPLQGHAADRSGRTTRLLGTYSACVAVCIALLWLVRPDPSYLLLGVVLLAIGTVLSEFAGVTYNALLSRVSTPANVGRVSALSWGAGYLGGIVLLLIIKTVFVDDPGLAGISHEDGQHIRAAMLLTAVWYTLAALPVLFARLDRIRPELGADSPLTDGAETGPGSGSGPVTGSDGAAGAIAPSAAPGEPPARPAWDLPGRIVDGYRHLLDTLSLLWRTDRSTVYFMIAAAVYRDGLAGVFTFGGVIAAGSFGFSSAQVITFGVVANVVAGIATVFSGPLDDHWGPRRVVLLSLTLMIAAALVIFFFHSGGTTVFWIAGLILCIFVGPAQAASRSLLTRLIPPGREAEMFGLYATTGRAVSFMAPLLFSLAIALGQAVTGRVESEHWGILGIVVVLAAGLALLIPVRTRHDRA